MKPTLRRLAAALLALVALNAAVHSARQTIRIKAVQAEWSPLELLVRAPGVLEPEKNATLKADFDGPILQKLFKEGDTAISGQVLAEIGRDNIKMQYMARENEVTNAEIELRRATKELRLQQTLKAQGAVAASAVEEAERALIRARQNVEVATTTFRMEALRWSRNVIRAPFDGTVIKDHLGAEGAVSAGKELLRFGDLTSYVMQVFVDELDIGQIQEGQSAVIRLQAYEDRLLEAVVVKLGTQAEERGSVVYPVKLKILDAEGLPLLPQFTGESRIRTGQTEPVVSVPLTALASGEGRRWVWAVTPLRRLKRVPVEVGRSNGERVEIVRGLKAGVRVCASAGPELRAGMRVSLE